MSKLRTIKFRGFNKKRGEWIYGSHILNRGAHFIAPDEFADGRTWEDYEVTLESIGQFTGLQDCKGVDIYEGDIVLCDEIHSCHEIVYDAPFFCIKEVESGDMRIISDIGGILVVDKAYDRLLEEKGWTKMQDGKPA